MTSEITAAVVPGTDILQLFYRGQNGGVYSRWRNADGSWSNEQSLGGVLTSEITAAVVPGTDILQLFYRGQNFGVYTRWRNADGSWSNEQSLGGVLTSEITAATVPATTVLQLFYRGQDNGMWSRRARTGWGSGRPSRIWAESAASETRSSISLRPDDITTHSDGARFRLAA